MTRVKTVDPDGVLDAATDLFWRRGFGDTGVRDLVDELGISRSKLRLGEDPVRIDVADGRLEVARGEAPSADAIIETDAPTLLALIRGRRTLAAAQRAGDVAIVGDDERVARFLTLFRLPSATPGG